MNFEVVGRNLYKFTFQSGKELLLDEHEYVDLKSYFGWG
jgi:hypothetical protein